MEEVAHFISVVPEYGYDDKSGAQGSVLASKRPRSLEEEMQESDGTNQNKKAKFVSQIPANIRILMASKDAGPVIGKGGAHIRSLRDNYRANVLLPDCAGPERILIISTTLSNACSILMDILKVIEGNNKSGRDMSLKMLVHQSQAGAIIGKNGSNIKEFREKYKTMIKVYPECAPISSERVVEIRGQTEVIASTVYALVEFLQGFLPIGNVYPYDPIHFDESFAAEYGGFVITEKNPSRGAGARGAFRTPRGARGHFTGPFQHQPTEVQSEEVNFGCDVPKRGGAFGGPRGGIRGGHGFVPAGMPMDGFEGFKPYEEPDAIQIPVANQAPPSEHPFPLQAAPFAGGGNEEVEVSQVTIPSELAGAIIGQGGCRIKQIRQESCATINIDAPRKGVRERIITIHGTQGQIQLAQYLLQTSVKKFTGQF